MGIFSDLLINSKSLDITLPTTALDRAVKREIDDIISRGDIELPTSLQQGNSIQVIEEYGNNPTGGTFTLTFTLRDGTIFTTAGIAFDANIATVEAAIDTAASGVVTGWVNGDITVTGGLLTATDVILTFDGASVSGNNHSQTVIEAAFTGGDIDEVQTVEITGTPTGGTWTLQLQLNGLVQRDVTGLAHNISAAALETAIDVAATGFVPGWTNGDIVVTGITVEDGTGLTLTFSGASVAAQNHQSTTADITGLTGGTPVFANATTSQGNPFGALSAISQTITTAGQTNRPSWAALVALSVVPSSVIPEQGVDPVSFTTPGNPSFPSKALIRLLAEEAAIEDDNIAVQDKILAAHGLVG